MSGTFKRTFPALTTLLGLIFLAEALIRMGMVKEFIFPAPSHVVLALIDQKQALIEALLSTLVSATLGLLLSCGIGSLVALVFSMSPFLRAAIYPYAVFFQTVPLISIAPLLVIWFGFGQPTVVVSSFIVSLFPVIANTLLGLQSVDPQLVELFQLYGASKKKFLLKLKIPFALPYLFSGFRIAAGLAVVGAIVGEFIAGGGLGSVIDSARTQQRIDLVFAAILLSSLVGLAFLGALNFLSRKLLSQWHVSEQ